jgi:pimeloyl-ACP methyl ester carboxylesterase
MSAYGGLVPLLAEHLRVVTYDRRGRGDSGDADSYHPDLESEDLDAVIRAVGGRGAVYGYSAGALLALRAASASSGITGLVVLEPPLHDDSDPRPDPLTVDLAELVARGDRAGAVRRFHEAIGVPDEFIADLARSSSWSSMVEVAQTAVYDCMISDAVDRSLLARVMQPTLVLDSAGSSDDLSGWAADVAALLPAATHRSLPGQWHTVADDILAPAIVDHVAATSARVRR